ncbi:MAG: autotransporter outer membrane beta-barrel domain-containing protein [Pseudolabrys sp.]
MSTDVVGSAPRRRAFCSGRKHCLLLASTALVSVVLVEAAAAADQVYTPPAGTTQNVSTVISDGGTATTVKMQGAGTVVLQATNTYSGGTTLSKGTLEATNNSSVGTGAVTLDGGAFKAATGSSLNIGNNVLINNTGGTVNTNGTTLELSGNIGNGSSGNGALNVTGNGTLVLSGNNFYTGPTNVLTGTLVAASGNAFSPASMLTINSGAAAVISDGLFAAIGPLSGGGSLVIGPTDPFTSLVLFMNGKNTTFSGSITGAGALEVDGPGTLTLTGKSNIAGSLDICFCAKVTLDGGSFKAGNGAFIDGLFKVINGANFTSRVFTAVGGNMLVSGKGTTVTSGTTAVGGVTPAKLTISGGAVFNTANGAEIDSFAGAGVPVVTVTGAGSQWNVHGGLFIGGGSTGGPGMLTIANGGKVYSPAFTVISNDSTLNLGTGKLAGSLVTPEIVNDGAIVANFTDTLKLGAEIDGNGTLTKKGAGTLILTNDNTYSGNTTVSGGTLEVDGTIENSLIKVTNGARLTGKGTVFNTQIAKGGTLAPGSGKAGTTLTIDGRLAFKAGSHYATTLGSSGASKVNVTGKASLNGNVIANVGAGTSLSKQYTILHSGGLNGTTFTGVTTNSNFLAGLSYTTTDAILTLTGALGAGGGLGGNQQGAANAVNTFFNNSGALPANFSAVYNLTGGALSQALAQLSGEAAVSGQRGAFQMMNEFLDLMLDPSADGRSGAGGAALGFAPEQQASLPSDVTQAYASVFKAPANPAFEQRWRTWGAGFGGYSKANGDAAAGTHDVTARTYGVTGGIDYRVNPDTVIGFAVAGAGGNWSLPQSLGGGHDDAFQAGIYAMTHSGPAYLSAALAFANHWMSTDRNAFGGDHLTASFNAQSYGGRVETGYRFPTLPVSVTPYAALQAQAFHTPAYSEADVTAGGFGLNFGSRNATDTRGELGARFDTTMPLRDGMSLTLRARAAWAHDWVDNPSLAATFQTLPGASFTVNGAASAKDSALTSLGAELRINRAWSIAAKFDGEFASGVQTYSGTGTIRYVW